MENRPKSCNRVSITTSKYHPIRKQPAFTPQAPSGTCGASSLRSGAMGLVPCHIGLFANEKCLLWNPSVTPTACQLPLTREPFCAWYRHCLKSKNPGKQRLSRGFSYFRREFPTKTGLDFPKQAGLFLLPGMILPPFPGKNQQEPEKTL